MSLQQLVAPSQEAFAMSSNQLVSQEELIKADQVSLVMNRPPCLWPKYFKLPSIHPIGEGGNSA